jgi:hypothetical protein
MHHNSRVSSSRRQVHTFRRNAAGEALGGKICSYNMYPLSLRHSFPFRGVAVQVGRIEKRATRFQHCQRFVELPHSVDLSLSGFL